MSVEQLDDDDIEHIAEEVISELGEERTIGDKILVSRREAIALASGSLGLGALLSTGVDQASAASGTLKGIDQIGTSNDRVSTLYVDTTDSLNDAETVVTLTIDQGADDGTDGIIINGSSGTNRLEAYYDGTDTKFDPLSGAVRVPGEFKYQAPVGDQVTATTGSSHTVDLAASDYHKLTLTADTTISFSNQQSSRTNVVTLKLVQDGTGGRTPSFSPTVQWAGGSAPSFSTAANAEDIVTLIYDADGSKWDGFNGGLDRS